ncbi:MAG: hypothetical protein ACJ75B_22075 [Flavisolibacter sp.]
MVIRKVIILKMVSICLIALTVYLFAGNMGKYFEWQELKSPLFSEDFIKQRSDFHLHIAIALILSLAASVLFHKFRMYILAIGLSLFALLLINYFPQLFE